MEQLHSVTNESGVISTHKHKVCYFANPFMVCDVCSNPVEGYVLPTDEDVPCPNDFTNIPCGHLGTTSTCPSWGPVDGCQCMQHLGEVRHNMRGRRVNGY